MTTPAPAPAPVAEPSAEPTAEPAPVITHETVRERRPLAFGARTQRTDELDQGVRQVARTGRAGVRVVVFRTTMRDGVEVARHRVRSVVARRPVARVVLLGTHVEPPPRPVAASPTCDSNYAGGCVPIASDVDCGGGSGNGPAYVYGTVEVTGSDIYGLDSDGDGYGCE